VAGREYLDYHLSSGPALLGHAHPAITEAVAAQLPKGTTYYFLNEPEILLAERLVEAIPCADVVHYTGSGTEATFYSLRIARAFTGRNKILKFEGAWHGMHDYGLWGTVPTVASDYPRPSPTPSACRRKRARRCSSPRSTMRRRPWRRSIGTHTSSPP
jgi:glutamate-1-semialdehyde 2,1-aminomutase